MRKYIAIAAAASALLACHRKEVPKAQAPVASAAPLLQRAITKDLLGERVEYLESVIGPAMHVAGSVRDYRPDGCVFQVGVKDDLVEWFRLGLSDKCTFNLALFIPDTQLPGLRTLTFAQAEKLDGPLRYSADCLDGCGRESAAGMYAHYFGPESQNEIEYALEVNVTDAGALAASDAWRRELEIKHGAEWVIANNANCSEDANGGARFLADLRVSHIWVGKNIITPDASCPQPDVGSAGAADDGIHANVVESAEPTSSYTDTSFRQKITGMSAQQLISTLGRPDSVSDGYPIGAKVYFYDTAQGGGNAGSFKVFDAASGTALTNITVSLDPSGHVSDVRF